MFHAPWFVKQFSPGNRWYTGLAAIDETMKAFSNIVKKWLVEDEVELAMQLERAVRRAGAAGARMM
jgi:hypothetical protein